MGAEVDNDYEFEERAAIREFDGGLSRNEANFYARIDIEARVAQDNIRKRKEAAKKKIASQKQIVKSFDDSKKSQINILREKREAIGQKMRAETDKTQKDKLFAEWMDLSQQIIDLRKESCNEHDRRLPG